VENITFIVAFTAGILSFFSPCIFPLVPVYVTHLTGSRIEENKINIEKQVLMIRSIAFILGFSVVFVILGATASVIGQLFFDYSNLIEKISGIFIIIFGLQMAGIIQLRFLMIEKKWSMEHKSKNAASSFLLGLAFGSGWTPCIGLALSSILLLAGSTETLYTGMLLLWIYALGLGIPFLFISLALTYSLGIMKKINRYLPTLSKVSGAIMIGMGILLYTGQFQKITAWLARFSIFVT
jgi:cytochrome c-type biogenesis protein